MNSSRQGAHVALAIAVLCWSVSSPRSAGAGEDAPVARGFSWSFEGTGSGHTVSQPYLGTAGPRASWMEGFERLRVRSGSANGLWFGAGGVLMMTAGTDDYDVHDVGDGRLDQLVAGAVNVAGSGVSVTAGRQDLVVGDGFLIGDGYLDTRAALWNIPLGFYDALRLDWARGPLHALGFGANLSHSFGSDGARPAGVIAGGELGLAYAERTDLSVAYLQRFDHGGTDVDATAVSLRGSWARGPATVAGEGVLEGGKQAGVTANGRGGHLRLELAGQGRGKPAGVVEYFHLSGDDPATPENEAYDPWQTRWNDWSQYYVGDLLASTVLTSSNMRILCAQVGLTPREGTLVRLLAHRMDRDRAQGPRAFAYEYDLVVEQAFGEHFSAWVMGGFATPLAAARAEFGSRSSSQSFASVSWKFSGPGAAE